VRVPLVSVDALSQEPLSAARMRACVRQVFKRAHGTQEAISPCRSASARATTKRIPHTPPFIFCFAITEIWRLSACTILNPRFLAKLCTPCIRQGQVLLLHTPPPLPIRMILPLLHSPYIPLSALKIYAVIPNGLGTERAVKHTSIAQSETNNREVQISEPPPNSVCR